MSKNPRANTYFLAMGKSTENHTEVVEHYLAEAMELMKSFDFYYGDENIVRRTALALLFYSANRPK